MKRHKKCKVDRVTIDGIEEKCIWHTNFLLPIVHQPSMNHLMDKDIDLISYLIFDMIIVAVINIPATLCFP